MVLGGGSVPFHTGHLSLLKGTDGRDTLNVAHSVQPNISNVGAHTTNAGVQQTGCRALRKLASNNDANRTAISGAGGIAAVVAGMGAHTSVAGVERQGRLALKILSGSDRRP